MIIHTKAEFFAEMRRKYERSWYARWDNEKPQRYGDHDMMAIGINYEIWEKKFMAETHINKRDSRIME